MKTDTNISPGKTASREQMNIVVVGHVDHGKSTVIGRLLADTGSLPQGKLEMVQQQCRQNARPFEYAFLLDALKDEQAQGITIDSARCFFKSAKREYIIIDAPGHIEFLKNMISGAARAEAGLLVIDAHEGVQENSRRHGYLVSMLGVRQLAVCVNKMDLVNFDQGKFDAICQEYTEFLNRIGITPKAFIPLSARNGDNITEVSQNTPWYKGHSVLDMLDEFQKEPAPVNKPLRLPVQDIYKFTAENDDRRIIAGRILTGSLDVGDEIVFLPSGKKSQVASIEAFNSRACTTASAGESMGITLSTQIYVKPGELICKADQVPGKVTSKLQVNMFWLSPNPMVMGKRYKMKLAGVRTPVWLTDIATVLDASDLSTTANRLQIEKHDMAECTLETYQSVACDLAEDLPQTGRFVIIDNYEIAGGGVILDAPQDSDTLIQKHVHLREQAWDRSSITTEMRTGRFVQRSALVVLCGPAGVGKKKLAKSLEEYLFSSGRLVYYLGLSNSLIGIDSDLRHADERVEFLRRLGEMAHLFTDAGVILITAISDLNDDELNILDTLNQPSELVVIGVQDHNLFRRKPDLSIETADRDAMREIHELLHAKEYLPEYFL